uniref:MARVEL domain-containing protein n=1 Tax=Trichuris muris TaxID=70415 RepID=A0A5S6QWF0_TRIMR
MESRSKMQWLVATISNGKLKMNRKLADALKNYSRPRFSENCKHDETYKQENGPVPRKNALPETPEPTLATVAEAQHGVIEEAETMDQLTDNPITSACCDCLPPNYATFVIALVEVAIILAWFVLHSFYPAMTVKQTAQLDSAAISARAVVTVVLLGTVVLLFVGIFMKRPWLLWPHMIVQLATVCVGMVMTFVTVLVMSIGSEASEYVFAKLFSPESIPWFEVTLGPIWPFCLAVIFNFTAAIAIWFYSVVKNCYHDLNSRNMDSLPIDNSITPNCCFKIFRTLQSYSASNECTNKKNNAPTEEDQSGGIGRHMHLVKL